MLSGARRLVGSRLARRREETGAVVVVTAVLTSFVLIVVAALTVDLGNVWARRGHLQTQADNAAIFAAGYLPASQPTTRLNAAKAAVWYIACHPVAGQEASVNSAFPIPRGSDGRFSCPYASYDTTQTTYATAASTMMANGSITFPNAFEIQVTTPWARVQFGFGKVAGAKDSIQTKSATAHVYSPGQMVPMGGSVGCIAAAAQSTGLLGAGDTLSSVAPVNYWSAGGGSNSYTSSSGAGSSTPTWAGITAPLPVLPQNLTTDTATLNGAKTQLTLTYSITTGLTGFTTSVINGLLSNLVGQNVTVWFGKGPTSIPVSVPITVVGTTTVAVPAAVQASPGQWYVKVVAPMPTYRMVLALPVYTGSTPKQATTQRQIDISAADLSDVTNLNNFVSCARPMLSPRSPSGGTSQDMISNIRGGLDHNLSSHPNLATAAQGLSNPASTSVSTLAAAASPPNTSGFAFACGADAASVKDTTANATAKPNCVSVDTSVTYDYEFTQGFLTANGRLSCSRTACTHGTFNGSELGGLSGQYNNDTISDFITGSNKQSVLNDLLFTSLDTFLQPSIPVLTPANQVSSAIYSSPRFFWAPVLTTVYTPGKATADYPIMTFRPAFITQESPTPTAAQKLLSALALELRVDIGAVISAGITSLLNGTILTTLQTSIQLNMDGQSLLASLGDPTKKEKYGLVYDTATTTDANHRLKAVRVMNINPGALPAVDPTYTGPVSDYFGSGPKVIRLVK